MRDSSPRRVRVACAVACAALCAVMTNAVGVTRQAKTAAAADATSAFDQQMALANLQERIGGHESEPAEKVFDNIQILKGVPAGRLLKIMDQGFARSLGVDCTHCHNPAKWESEEKPALGIARDMWRLMHTINDVELKKIKALEGDNPSVNCTTCHRGERRPALNFPEDAAAGRGAK